MQPNDDPGSSARRCTTWTPAGPSVLLRKSLPFEQTAEQPGQEATRILARALSLIEPRSLDLHICFRPLDEPYLEDARPAYSIWHMRRDDVPPDRARPAMEPDQERIVPEINAATLDGVLAEALAQAAPPGRLVTFEYFTVEKLRARLLRPDLATAQSLPVWRRGRFEFAVPIVHDTRGAWIDSYPDPLDRPLELEVDNNDGAVRAQLSIGWSLWKEEGSPEHAAIVDFARTLMTWGYQVDDVGPEFAKWLP
jgi:hypothetical protein